MIFLTCRLFGHRWVKFVSPMGMGERCLRCDEIRDMIYEDQIKA